MPLDLHGKAKQVLQLANFVSVSDEGNKIVTLTSDDRRGEEEED
jgi:hypothetical protein